MRARILFVPIFADFEARSFREQVRDWADVESFDSPGAGTRRGEPPGGIEDVAAAASERLDELGWPSCVLICDSHAQAAAIELALSDPRVAGICVSHAAVRYSTEGERPALIEAVHAAAAQLLVSDLRSFGHALTQLTQGKIDEDWVDGFIAAVPRATARARTGQLDGRELVARLHGSELEVLLGMHRGCLMWTPEGFEDAVALVPHAATVVCDEVPYGDPNFLAATRELCARVFG
jgi:hypothetical protein